MTGNTDAVPYQELVMRVVDGEAVIVTAPPRILIGYQLLALADPARLSVAGGLVTLLGSVDYRVVTAEQSGLVLELVADRRPEAADADRASG